VKILNVEVRNRLPNSVLIDPNIIRSYLV